MTDNERVFTVLVVDDQLGVRRLLFEAFQDEGYNVELAQNGPDALNKIDLLQPDLILMDMKMPGMSGLEVLRQLKKEAKELKVILMTAYGELEIIAEAMALGVADYVTKPFDINEVRALVKKVL